MKKFKNQNQRKNIVIKRRKISQNKLLTYLWYLNLGCTLRGLEVIQRFNNSDNNNKDQYRYQW